MNDRKVEKSPLLPVIINCRNNDPFNEKSEWRTRESRLFAARQIRSQMLQHSSFNGVYFEDRSRR